MSESSLMKMNRFLFLILVFTIFTRGFALSQTSGFVHPDSLYQYLEQAHRLVFGYGLVPWEYQDGIRSWFYPLLISSIFKLGILFGVNEISSLVFFVRIFSTIVSILLVYSIYLLGKSLFDENVALVAAFFTSCSGLFYVWSARVMPELVSSLFICLGLFNAWESIKKPSRSIFSGFFFGIAFMTHFTSALVFTSAVVVLYARKHSIRFILLGFLIVLLLQGILDYFTWGGFFHSPIEFLTANVIQGKSGFFGVQPPQFYLIPLVLHIPLMFFLAWSIRRDETSLFLAGNFLFYFIIMSILPHKEVRFLFNVMPLFIVLSAKGFITGFKQLTKNQADYVNKIISVIFFVVVVTQVSIMLVLPNFWSGWDSGSSGLEAMRFVGGQPDLSAVAYTMHWYNSGVYTHLHRDVPAYHIVDVDFNSTGYLSDKIVVPAGFDYIYLEELPSTEDVNYVVSSSRSLPLIKSRVDESLMEVAMFGEYVVLKRA